MGRRSDLRAVAAVAIQRWYGRRREVVHAVRLLGTLHVIKRDSERGNEIAQLIREVFSRCVSDSTNGVDVSNTAVSGDKNGKGANEGAVAFYAVAVLIDVAKEYEKRLHKQNWSCLSLDASRVRAETKVGPSSALTRCKLLPDTVLEDM
uniref:Uncharacterized protein TCIL3000_6_620 n=1 Tax=Trypanosoma congolense (strain IL3000) TaxID=1068625 RepID=G0UN76_TRYCI|nr:unnamed protein product [Trypanosoma congolense IL3000]